MSTVGELRAEAGAQVAVRAQVGHSALAIDRREIALLLGRVLGLSEAQILARPERRVSEGEAATFRALVRRRTAGEPFAYLVGDREFFGRRFAVDERVLIPRPETEHLIEALLELELPSAARVLDVGTGSGCIALTLKLERPDWHILASDRSLAALQVARLNRHRFGLDDELPLLLAPFLETIGPGTLDLVVSNPPYVVSEQLRRLPRDVADYEPTLALDGGGDGLDGYRRLFGRSYALRPGGWMALEIGAGQLEGVTGLAADGFELHEVRPDYAGHARIVILHR